VLKDAAKTLQGGVWMRPKPEDRIHRGDNLLQSREIAVMKTAAAQQLPDPFNRIELRTVGRQEMQIEMVLHCLAPRLMQAGVVIPSVVDDRDQLAARAPVALQFSIKVPAGDGVEHAVGSRHDQFTVLESHGTEKADALAGGRVPTNGILHLRRNPHAAARTVLLKVNFIHRPQINIIPSRQCAEFFYAWLAKPDPTEPLAGAACAAESQAGGKAAGTGAPSVSLPAPDSETGTMSGHPTDAYLDQTGPGWPARRPPLLRVGRHRGDWGDRGVDLRSARPIRRFRTAAPNSRPCDGNPPTVAPPEDTSCLEPPAERHAVDDHNERRRCAGSHPEEP